ncbi:MAG: hypothetical protein J6B64_01750 [Bacilli bacterium]|nr:hypothetical protein [Bacilli bacterium]MBP3921280.1 hypothetical protein [Bacilli bacterium]
MNFNNNEFTLLSDEQTFGSQQIDVIKKMGGKCAISDFAILLGAYVSSDYHVDGDNSMRGRTGWWYLSSSAGDGDVRDVDEDGARNWTYAGKRSGAVRPALPFSNISDISLNGVKGRHGFLEVEYGEYPQYAVDTNLGRILDDSFQAGVLRRTGKTYTTDSRRWNANSERFSPVQHEEFEYNGKRYVRVKSNDTDENFKLSNGVTVHPGMYVWLEVSPIKWIVDDRAKMLVSKTLLASGIRFCNDRQYNGDFKNTEMYQYLNTYFARDMVPSVVKEMTPEEKKQYEEEQKRLEKRRNPYGLKFGQVSEEQIIKGAIESGVAVFLHGPSSEGKSARVKQIDPDCVIIYLRNATPESLNGKSVYNSETGEMIDVKPSWLKKIEEKCEKEPDRMHIVFLDEITNALPSIQGIAFNIVLDREVNGVWKLPENARIVAAGNDMKDSLAANQLAEPLFNRFAHVYIKTTTESWLKWASEHNIHPAIYSYIAYKKGETLRSEYNGETPNADPRKWEMASKMLYATGSPEMLRALVGEDITREFVQFCNQQVITLDDVINGNYTDRDIQNLNTAERYATTMGLSQVEEEHLDKVRGFVTGLGAEFGAIFDALWIHGDESRLERIAEAKLANMPGGGIRR